MASKYHEQMQDAIHISHSHHTHNRIGQVPIIIYLFIYFFGGLLLQTQFRVPAGG